jgi:hypothetical protein
MEDSHASDSLQHLDTWFSINPSAAVMQEDPLDNKWQDCTKESMLKILQEKSRTPEWYRAAAEKLAVSAKAIGMIQHHSHWKVRMEAASSCHLLLSRCCRFGSCFCYLSHSSIETWHLLGQFIKIQFQLFYFLLLIVSLPVNQLGQKDRLFLMYELSSKSIGYVALNGIKL